MASNCKLLIPLELTSWYFFVDHDKQVDVDVELAAAPHALSLSVTPEEELASQYTHLLLHEPGV